MRNGAHHERTVASRSLWMATDDPPVFAPLTADAHARVLHRRRRHRRPDHRVAPGARRPSTCVVLEEHDLHGGQTARTTGHLCDALDDRYFELEHLHGEHGARLAAHSHGVAIDTIEHICEEEGIDCGFARVDGYLVRGEGDPHADVLAARIRRRAARGHRCRTRGHRAGRDASASAPALRFPRQARFHALAYTTGLARAIVRMGGRIHTHSRVVQVDGGANAGATTDQRRARAVRARRRRRERAVQRSRSRSTPSRPRIARTWSRCGWIRAPCPTRCCGTRSIPTTTCASPQARNGTWLLVGGEDRKTGQDDSTLVHYEVLESWARSHFPMALDVGYRWSGQVIEPIDGLGFLGHNPGSPTTCTWRRAIPGNGLTHGTIAGC